MRMRTVYVSHADNCPTWVNVTEWQYGNFLENKKREYEPGKLSCNRLERLLAGYRPDHANLSKFHVSATWTLEGKADSHPLPFMDEPEALPFEIEPERCELCGYVGHTFNGLCSECQFAESMRQEEPAYWGQE